MAVQKSPIEETGNGRNNIEREDEPMMESRSMPATRKNKMRLTESRTEKNGLQMPQI
jgi:hypothetical protein